MARKRSPFQTYLQNRGISNWTKLSGKKQRSIANQFRMLGDPSSTYAYGQIPGGASQVWTGSGVPNMASLREANPTATNWTRRQRPDGGYSVWAQMPGSTEDQAWNQDWDRLRGMYEEMFGPANPMQSPWVQSSMQSLDHDANRYMTWARDTVQPWATATLGNLDSIATAGQNNLAQMNAGISQYLGNLAGSAGAGAQFAGATGTSSPMADQAQASVDASAMQGAGQAMDGTYGAALNNLMQGAGSKGIVAGLGQDIARQPTIFAQRKEEFLQSLAPIMAQLQQAREGRMADALSDEMGRRFESGEARFGRIADRESQMRALEAERLGNVFSAGQEAIGRSWQSGENAADRALQQAESALERQVRISEAARDRALAREQAAQDLQLGLAGVASEAAGVAGAGGGGGSGGGGASGGRGVLEGITPTQERKIRSQLESILRNPNVPTLDNDGPFSGLRFSKFVDPDELIASLVEDFGVTKAQARHLMKTSQYWDQYRSKLAARRRG